MDVLGANPQGLLIDRATAGAEDARLRRLGTQAPARESREALEKTAREFEAVFLNQLMKVMRETVPENELFNSGGATKYYRQMHDAEVAQAMASGRTGLGIADLIVQQFAQNVAAKEDAAGAAPATAPAAAPAGAVPSAVRQGPPAPVPAPAPRGEVQGPPAPTALERYRSMAPVAGRVAETARLRDLAAAQGAAVADTLRRFEHEIGSAADRAGLEPSLVLAVVMEESGGDPVAVSPKGAVGLMQLMPGTAAEVGVADPTSPGQNLRGGADYLARMVRRYEGRLDLALAAYNAGPGNVDRAGRAVPEFRETRRYVDRVLERYRSLGGSPDTGMEIANGNP